MRLPLALFAASAVACGGTPAAAIASRPIRLGQIARVGGPQVRPLEVLEDSRCPMNARCVWAGNVILRVKVSGGGWSRVVDLTLGKPEHVADGALTLTNVTPDRVTGQRLRPDRLRFTFAFDGGL